MVHIFQYRKWVSELWVQLVFLMSSYSLTSKPTLCKTKPRHKEGKRNQEPQLKKSQNPNSLAKKERRPDYNTEKYHLNEMLLIPVLDSENLVIFSNEKIIGEREKFPIPCPIQENQEICKFIHKMSHVNP